MAGLVIGVMCLFAAIVCFAIGCVYAKKARNEKYEDWDCKAISVTMRTISAISAVITVISIGAGCMKSVPTGNTGIVTVFGEVRSQTYEAGLHFAAPWVKVICMDNRVQKQQIQMTVFSSDIQEVDVTYSVNYQINKANAQDIYRTIGTHYYDIVVVPKVQETVKQVVAKYNAESLISNRAEVSATIEDGLKNILAGYNIELVAASMENMDFTDAFTNAVEAKQVAEQNKIKAQTEQEQAIIEAKAAAEKVRIDAQAQADAQLIAAQNDVEVQKLAADAAEYAGQKQAAVNERISQSLTPELNQYYLIEAWKDGAAMPNTVVGDSSLINGVLNYGK